MTSDRELLRNLYKAFNAGEHEKILSMMKPDVQWANGMDGGFLFGREAVREYWRRQFAVTRGELKPLQFERDQTGRQIVTAHLKVKDLAGNLLVEKTVKQIFTFEDGAIRLFEIADSEPLKLI